MLREHSLNGRTVSPSTNRNPLQEVPQEAWLAANLLTLARDLRAAGLNIGSGQVMSLVEAVSAVDCHRRDDFYSAAKTTLVTSPDHIPVFDAVFGRFWRKLLRPETLNQDTLEQHQFDMPPAPTDSKDGSDA